MKIELSGKSQKAAFGEILIGEVFRYYGDYYIKSMTTYQSMVGVNLTNGTQQKFDNHIEVEIVDCALTLK